MVEVKYVPQSHKVIALFHDGDGTSPHNFIAHVARTCYKSPARGESADRSLVGSLVEHEHTAMLEHSFLSVEIVTDRAIANEIVRHRHFSFAQESTRYVNYGRRGFEFVMPDPITPVHRMLVEDACEHAANVYDSLVESGMPPQIARSTLPLCTATKIVVSGNFTEWRHFFRLRTAKDAHPMMRTLAGGILEDVCRRVPVVFDDIRAEVA